MAIVYGYARCSTEESRQDVDRQIRELKKLGVSDNHIFFEYESGRKIQRVEFQKLLNTINEGDSIVVTEVSRLSRSTKQFCDLLNIIQEKRICLIIGSFIVDCSHNEIDPMTKGMLLMWAVFAELERDMISDRVKSGIANARDKGKTIGRPALTVSSIPHKFFRYYPLYMNQELSITAFARLVGCSRTSIYKYLDLVNPKNMV